MYSAYSEGSTISSEPARALRWVDTNAIEQPTCERAVAALCILLSMQIVLVSVEDGDAGLLVQPCVRLETGFPADCFSWSKDSSQLLVGGAGQIVCFIWGRLVCS